MEPAPRPKKNYALYTWLDEVCMFAPQLFAGEAGELPLLLAVNIGYDGEDPDKYMYPYESGEVMFAYKRGAQKRMMFHDSHKRTLSIPYNTPIKFSVNQLHGQEGTEDLTLEEIAKTRKLPVRAKFADCENLEIEVDRRIKDHTFFGDLLLYTVYDEPYFYCLPLDGAGRPRDKLTCLPCRLKEVSFTVVTGMTGVADPEEKIREQKDRYSQLVKSYFDEDPFFKEMAFVHRGENLLRVQDIPSYIDQSTFMEIKLVKRRRPIPFCPDTAPPLPSRNPAPQIPKLKTKRSNSLAGYTSVRLATDDSHLYDVIRSSEDSRLTPPTVVVKPYSGHSEGIDNHSLFQPVKQKAKTPVEKGSESHLASSLQNTLSKLNPARIASILPHAKVFSSDDCNKNLIHCLPSKGTPLSQEPLHQSLPSHRHHALLSQEPLLQPSSSHRGQTTLSQEPPALPERAAAATLSFQPLLSHSSELNVEELTIEQVAKHLKELGLKKYSDKFKKNRIDGKLLTQLSRETLLSEFKMSETEILRVLAFAKDGHIPK